MKMTVRETKSPRGSILNPPALAILAAASLTLGCATPVFANDSEAAVGVGGLILVESKNISLDYEDLYISEEEVRITYRFTNHGRQAVDTLIAFPLPVVQYEDGEGEGPISNYDWSQLAFETTVDGKPVELDAFNVATVGGRNVDALLKKYGWDAALGSDPEDHHVFDRLTQEQIDAGVKDGLLIRRGGSVKPAWVTQLHITRKQHFPAGKTVIVTHRYNPIVGGSVAGGLLSEYRTGKDGSGEYYAKDYCTDKDFLTSFDRKMAMRGEAKAYGETSVDYILSSGANWKGPIKDFRLVVDKGNPSNLVSFCMDGVKKISPTRFEVRKKNYEPKRDLSILIVHFPDLTE